MKKFLIAISFICILFSCKNSKEKNVSPQNPRNDTTAALVMYVALDKSDSIIVQYGFAERIVKDTFIYVDTDTLTKKKMWTVDTTYMISYPFVVDSSISKRYNVPMVDTAGRKNIVYLSVPHHKRFVRSGWENVDSAAAELRRTKR
jgi:hypothetical protein